MLIISLNINDFGGAYEQLACYKKINYKGNEVTDWNSWKKISKSHIIAKLQKYILKKKPTVIFLQEFELNNSDEPMNFINWMKEKGYEVKGVMPSYHISITIVFVKNDCNSSKINIVHDKTELDARDYAIKIREYVIYGTHVPLNSKTRPSIREDYWDEILAFYEQYKTEKIILMGDFNTYDKSSDAYKKYQQLLNNGASDLWLKLGKADSTPTEKKYRNRLDYVFVSQSMEKCVESMDIDIDIMDVDEISDHAAIILEIK